MGAAAVLGLAFCWGPGIHTATAQALQEIEQAFIDAAADSMNCCVKVDVVRRIQEEMPSGGSNALKKRKVTMQQTSLSGFLWDSTGHVATLGEALVGASRAWVSLYDGKESRRFKARVVGYRLGSNVGVVRIDESVPLEALPMGNSDEVRPGALVMGLGYPFNLGQAPSFSVGIVNATDNRFRFNWDQNREDLTFIQTSIELRPGETGGPLINTAKEVIGILVTSYHPMVGFFGFPAGFGNRNSSGVTLAMPINRVKNEVHEILEQAKKQSDTPGPEEGEPWLGLAGNEIPDGALRKQLMVPEGGVLVSHIYPNDPAALAGIRVYDVLKTWGNIHIKGLNHLKELIHSSKVGDKVKLRVIREGKSLDFEVRIGRF
jgi:serine protease Do